MVANTGLAHCSQTADRKWDDMRRVYADRATDYDTVIIDPLRVDGEVDRFTCEIEPDSKLVQR